MAIHQQVHARPARATAPCSAVTPRSPRKLAQDLGRARRPPRAVRASPGSPSPSSQPPRREG
eukprot:14158719-Alexandrium_andersonii.AAC.1